MKIYVLFHNYFNGCDCWETPLGYYGNNDLAEYLKLELETMYHNPPDSFFVREVDLDNSGLESYSNILEKIKMEI